MYSESQRTATVFMSADQRRAEHATPAICIPSVSLIAGYTPIWVTLSAVTHAFSHVREEQVQLVSSAMVTYSVRERTYI